MTGKLYEAVTAHRRAVSDELLMLRSGQTAERVVDMKQAIKTIEKQRSKAAEQSIAFVETIKKSDDTSVRKLHLSIDECLDFLADVRYLDNTLQHSGEEQI